MLSLFTIWQSFSSFVNTFQGGWYRPQTDFEKACNDISNLIWEDWTGQAEKSQEIKDHLAPFLKPKNLIVKSANSFYGTIEYPKDYGRFATASILVAGDGCLPCKEVDDGKCSNGDFKTPEEITDEYYDNAEERQVIEVDQQRWAACISHLTKCPTLDEPKMLQIGSGFNVAPRKVSVVVFNYYVRPKTATFKYTKAPGNIQTGAGDQIIYSPAPVSTELEWPPTVINEFVIRLGERYGLFSRDQFVTAVSGQMKKTA